MGIPGSGNSRELSGIPGSDFSLPGSETWENRQNPPVTVDAADASRVLYYGQDLAKHMPQACPTVLSYPSTRQSHWKCLSGFGEAPARLPVDLPDFREFPPGVAIPGNSREFPTPETLLPGNWPTIGRSANFDSDCDSEGFMCTGSSARASGLRKLQFALYILDTRGFQTPRG